MWQLGFDCHPQSRENDEVLTLGAFDLQYFLQWTGPRAEVYPSVSSIGVGGAYSRALKYPQCSVGVCESGGGGGGGVVQMTSALISFWWWWWCFMSYVLLFVDLNCLFLDLSPVQTPK